MQSLIKNCLFDQVEDASAAATTTLTSDVLDMSGFDGVTFIAILGDVTSGSVLLLSVLDDTDTNVSGATAITGATAGGTAGASDADLKLIVVDVYRPLKRYVHCTLARGTQNAVVNGIVAIRWRGRESPVTQSGVYASTFITGS